MRYYSLWCVRLFWGKHGTTSKNQTWQENATTTTTTTFPNAFSPQTKMIKPSKPNRTPNLHHVSRLVFLQAFHTLPLAFVASYWAFVILDTSTGRPRRSRVTPVEGWGNLQNGDSRWGGVIWLLVALHSKQKRFCQWRKTPGLSTPKIILRVFKPEGSQKSLLSKPVLVNIATRIPTKTNPAISRPLCFFVVCISRAVALVFLLREWPSPSNQPKFVAWKPPEFLIMVACVGRCAAMLASCATWVRSSGDGWWVVVPHRSWRGSKQHLRFPCGGWSSSQI